MKGDDKMTIFIYIPAELLGGDLLRFYDHLTRKLAQDYLTASFTSNYTGDGTLETADQVVFLYEFKDNPSCQREMKRCEDLGITYTFFKNFYGQDDIVHL